MSASQPNVGVSTKSLAATLLLTIFFGPFGMFYTTIVGAIVMILLSIVIGALTLGWGLWFTYPISILWAALAAGSYNRKILRQS